MAVGWNWVSHEPLLVTSRSNMSRAKTERDPFNGHGHFSTGARLLRPSDSPKASLICEVASVEIDREGLLLSWKSRSDAARRESLRCSAFPGLRRPQPPRTLRRTSRRRDPDPIEPLSVRRRGIGERQDTATARGLRQGRPVRRRQRILVFQNAARTGGGRYGQ